MYRLIPIPRITNMPRYRPALICMDACINVLTYVVTSYMELHHMYVIFTCVTQRLMGLCVYVLFRHNLSAFDYDDGFPALISNHKKSPGNYFYNVHIRMYVLCSYAYVHTV